MNKIIEEDAINEEKLKDDEAIIQVQKTNKYKKYLWNIGLIIILFLLLLFAMKALDGGNQIFTLAKYRFTVLTFAIWIGFYLILKGITGKTKISLSIVIGVEVIYDIINYIVRISRGSGMTISDIFAVKTGLSVAKSLQLQLDSNFYIAMALVIAIIGIIILLRKKFVEEKEKIITRVVKTIIGIAMLLTVFNINIYRKYSLWDMNDIYEKLGTPITIFRMLQDINVKPPKGYNKSEVEELMKKYEVTNTQNKDTANIIVIINESFSDYYNVYKEGKENPIKYFTELSKGENVISGVCYSSEYGGQTSNVEYEFLTQNSSRILPVGSYVFQQYITSPVRDSIVQHLKSQGYKTSAMHPWRSYAYSRNKIYKLFGFDSIKFKDEMEGLEENFNNDFYSDKSSYKELLKEIREKKKGEKLFQYLLTVQNHIGYTNPDPKQITYCDNNEKNVYMQLIHESSEALKEVIDELKNKDEKYVLLFFGDHQPNLDGIHNFVDRTTEKYQVPFLIWANYDIKEEYNVTTSTVFLQNYLLKAAGVKLSAMNKYMEDVQKEYPVITKKLYMDKNKKIFQNNVEEANYLEKLEEYNKVDYYRIFDMK